MKKHFLLLFLLITLNHFSQSDTIKHEVGFDCFVNASNLGGSYGIGAKYAIVKTERIVFGPSLRLQRMWSNYVGQKYSFTIYGGGVFFHYRLKNILFLGGELEFLKSPIYYNNSLSPTRWVPVCFVGGGYSHEFESIGVRLNAGVFYDIIANPNSPFFSSYVAKNANDVPIPIIYRIGFFFPLD